MECKRIKKNQKECQRIGKNKNKKEWKRIKNIKETDCSARAMYKNLISSQIFPIIHIWLSHCFFSLVDPPFLD